MVGLDNRVEIFRDDSGVPHIFANSLNDAYFALGYAHAQDRLWQMEAMRRLGNGRLSEILGDRVLRTDRLMRTLGIALLAEGDAAALPEQTRVALEAYAAGVNAWLATGSLPPEFTLLGHEPEPWKITDSLIWGRLMSRQLARGWSDETFRAQLAKRLSAEQINELWPADPPGAPYTYDAREFAGFDLRSLLGAVPPALGRQSASNAWVVDGLRSGTGAPVLANDPHLGFTAPGVWYLVRIVTPELTIAGATAPGLPFTILGHNGRVAWGVTATEVDSQDLFIETIDPADPERYLTPGGSEPISTRVETIRVKGGAPVTFAVRGTRHGPVLSNLPGVTPDAAPSKMLALAAANLAPVDSTASALMAMSRARDVVSFRAALADFVGPTVNVFYADSAGDIGIAARGRMPLRKAGNGRGPFAGADGEHDWAGFVPFDDLPHVENPPSGRLINGNNRMVADNGQSPIAGFWYARWRAERILEVVDSGPHGPGKAAQLQNDVLSGAARRLVPLMLERGGPIPKGGQGNNRVFQMMSNWDYRMDRDRPEPLIYTAWLHHAVRAIAGDELGEDFARYGRKSRARFVEAVLTENSHWCEPQDGSLPTCAQEISSALDAALVELSAALGANMGKWRWGDLHRATFGNRLLGNVPVIGQFADLSIPSSGGDHTVGRGPIAGTGATPYANFRGPGYRAVYDFSNLSRSRFIAVPGQSGNPFSPHYGDLMEIWRDGEYIRLTGDRSQIAATAEAHLALIPTVD